VVALADCSKTNWTSRESLQQIATGQRLPGVGRSQLFVGPKAFQQIAASKEVDAIVIATPRISSPAFGRGRRAGKHVYLEKPVAVDVPGAMKVIEIGSAPKES